ncbi:MAG: hypothetical protein FRX48_07834 [Lasallia pustulata]|uniref:Uncharacterized protein n=1 Tax=Lasallia pustulata TaxID=136370 RepID=A0A5M8PG73_9LECA|nr:MAG: hypothetical protein FRX48_07834 [Lasallia pustulata]
MARALCIGMFSWTGRDIGAILVAVSTQLIFETVLGTLVQANMDHTVRFLELEYQP